LPGSWRLSWGLITELDSIIHQAGWTLLPDQEFRLTRTLFRVLGRVELWNGESWRQVLSRDADENVIVWAWQMHGVQRDRYTTAMTDPANGHLRFVRLKNPGEVRRFLRSVGGSGGD
jgi:hypothetical protein